MGLRYNLYNQNDLYLENYCNLMNITTSIINYISNKNYNQLPCINQNKIDICNNVNNIFSNIYIVNPLYINIVNILNSSVNKMLNCNNINYISKKDNSYNYELILLIILTLIGIKYITQKLKKL
jgi:hypothetical protein